MQTLPPPSIAPGRATLATLVARPRGVWRLEALLVAALVALALAVRWPHLWSVPRFTDETLEVLHSLQIVREGARPLTNYDSYYGALYNYLVANALWATGESPFAPRLVVLVAAALTVAATYLLGRELAGGRGEVVAGMLAALMLATNGAHVVVNSHIAWSNCLTPLFTTLAFWALLRGGGSIRASPHLVSSPHPPPSPSGRGSG